MTDTIDDRPPPRTLRIRCAIAERVHARLWEWASALMMGWAGLLLLALPAIYELAPYAVLRGADVSAAMVAAYMLGVALARLAVLVLNGALRLASPLMRLATAAAACLAWTYLAVGIVMSGAPTLLVAFTGVPALAELVVVARAAAAFLNGIEAGRHDGHST